MKVTSEHGLTKQDAIERLDAFLARMQQEYSGQLSEVEQAWHDDSLEFSFRARGMKLSGNMTVTSTAVIVEVGLPLLARVFEGELQRRLKEGLDKVLGQGPS